jgi:hypothetical protein
MAMMCGCPIEPKYGKAKICLELPDPDQPWLPKSSRSKRSSARPEANRVVIPLVFTQTPPANPPGKFIATWVRSAAFLKS